MPVTKNSNKEPAESTEKKHSGLIPFKPGQSGNPAGRPKGSRNKLGEAFIAAMHDDFLTHGTAVIETVRTEKPDQYLKVIASILPKELHVKDASLGDMSDDELIELLAAVRSLTASNSGEASSEGSCEEGSKKRTGPARRTH
jgi:hypothetical protein